MEKSKEAVLVDSNNFCVENHPTVKGPDFNDKKNMTLDLLDCYSTMGFQGTHFSKAIEIINKMV